MVRESRRYCISKGFVTYCDYAVAQSKKGAVRDKDRGNYDSLKEYVGLLF